MIPMSSVGYYLFGKKSKPNLKILNYSKTDHLLENVSAEHLCKSSVYCTFAVVNKSESAENLQMSAKAT